MGNDWKFYNMIGLAPRSETSGPVLIQKMKQQNVISEEIATLQYNPYPKESVLTFGPIADSSEIIRGDWFEHKLVDLDDNHFGLNVEGVSYNDDEVSSGFNAILMSSVNNLMYIGGNEMDFYL